MIKIFAKTLVLTVCVTLMACTTLRPVAGWQSEQVGATAGNHHGLKPGDHITVTTTDNVTAEMEYVSLTADTLEGTVGKEKAVVQIPRDQVLDIERKEISALKTAGVALTVLWLVGSAVTLSYGAVGFPGY
jgi:hypothetical protein